MQTVRFSHFHKVRSENINKDALHTLWDFQGVGMYPGTRISNNYPFWQIPAHWIKTHFYNLQFTNIFLACFFTNLAFKKKYLAKFKIPHIIIILKQKWLSACSFSSNEQWAIFIWLLLFWDWDILFHLRNLILY